MAYFLILFGAIFLELSTISGGHATAKHHGPPPHQKTGLDVTDFGATGDGKTDDSKVISIILLIHFIYIYACPNQLKLDLIN